MTKFLAVGYAMGGLVVLGLLLFVFVDPLSEGRTFPPGQENRVLPYHDERNRTLRDVADRIALGEGPGRTILEKREGGRWHLTQPVAAPADPAAVTKLLDTLTGLERIRSVTLSDTKWSTLNNYGLRPVELQCEVRFGDDSYTLVVGKDARGRSRREKQVYARVGRSPLVEVVDVAVANAVGRSAEELRDRRIFRQGVLQARRVSIDGPHGPIVIEDSRDHWRMVEPRKGRVGSDALIELLKTVHELRVLRFVPLGEADFGGGGAGRSPLQCTLETWDNETTTLRIEGPVARNLRRVYATSTDGPGVFTLAWHSLLGLRVAPGDLLEGQSSPGDVDRKANQP